MTHSQGLQRLLLDTCVFLWMIWDERPVPEPVRDAITDRRNEVYVSVLSIWEAMYRHAQGDVTLHAAPEPWRHFVDARLRHDLRPLPLDERALRHLPRLPPLHGDPFDRLLICQAIEEGLTLVTPDARVRRYPVRTLWD